MRGNLAYRLAGFAIRMKNRFLKPVTVGVRAIVVDADGGILLVRHRGGGWYLPGGGVHKKESLPDALAREMAEEMGLRIRDKPRLFATYASFSEHKSDYVSVFVVTAYDIDFRENNEIEAYGFFNRGSLPEGTSPGTRRRIDEYAGIRQISDMW